MGSVAGIVILMAAGVVVFTLAGPVCWWLQDREDGHDD